MHSLSTVLAPATTVASAAALVLSTAPRVIGTNILDKHVIKSYKAYGGMTTSSIVEDMQQWTNTRLPDLEALVKELKEWRFETPEGLQQTTAVSSSMHWRSVIWKNPSGWWSMLNDSTVEETWKWTTWRQRIWLDVIEDPSPPVLIVKWFSVTMLGLAIYHDHLDDRYQDYFLVAGLGATAIVAHHFSESMMSGIQTYLPFCVILALCLSALVHRLGRATDRTRCRREEARVGWGDKGIDHSHTMKKMSSETFH